MKLLEQLAEKEPARLLPRKPDVAIELLSYICNDLLSDDRVDKLNENRRTRITQGLRALLPKGCGGDEHSRNKWMAALAATCLASARDGLSHPEEESQNTSQSEELCQRIRRGLLVWHTITNWLQLPALAINEARFQGTDGFETHSPYSQKLNGMSEDIRRIADMIWGIQRRCGPSYEIYFPLVYFTPDGDGGAIVVARLTVLFPPTGNGPDPLDSENNPLIIAPWSTFTPIKAEFDDLTNVFRSLLVGKVIADCPTSFLIEFRPPSAVGVGPKSVEWEGTSLGLAVALAAWAASKRRCLRQLVATGLIDGSGNVFEVGGLIDKANAAQQLLSASALSSSPLKSPPYFLYPNANTEPIQSACFTPFPVASLRALLQLPILHDGFDDYRHATATSLRDLPNDALQPSGLLLEDDANSSAYLVETWDWVKEYVKIDDEQSLLTEGSHADPVVATAVFDADPLEAASVLIRKMIEQMVGRGVDFRVPVPVRLSPEDSKSMKASEHRVGVAEPIQKMIVDGLEELGLSAAVDAEILTTTLRFIPSKLLLVVYGDRSTEMDFEACRECLSAIKRYADHLDEKGRAAGVLFIASDVHHAEFIRDAWEGEPVASA